MTSARRVASSNLPTRYGEFRLHVYAGSDRVEHMALTVGFADGGPGQDPVLVRIHSECVTGDLFGSRRCDCGEQLDESLRLLQDEGCGVLLYLRQEGRGIGLRRKIDAYALQEQGLDTVEANLALGLPEDARDYEVAACMLRDLSVWRAALITNNPAKVEGLEQHGIPVVRRLPLVVTPHAANLRYYETKRRKMGHLLPPLASRDGK
jgi:GTP cyclohydrolase II